MSLTVETILNDKGRGLYTISPDEIVQNAIDIMAEKQISALPVLDNGQLVGIISERDYIRKAAPKRQLPWEILVKDIMTSDVLTVSPEEPIRNCMQTMTSNRIRHLPVIEGDKLITMISISDIIKALRQVRMSDE